MAEPGLCFARSVMGWRCRQACLPGWSCGASKWMQRGTPCPPRPCPPHALSPGSCTLASFSSLRPFQLVPASARVRPPPPRTYAGPALPPMQVSPLLSLLSSQPSPVPPRVRCLLCPKQKRSEARGESLVPAHQGPGHFLLEILKPPCVNPLAELGLGENKGGGHRSRQSPLRPRRGWLWGRPR